MKTLNVAAILAVAALSAIGISQRPGMGRDPKQMAERQTSMMTQTLNLTPAQQAKVKAILLKSATEMKKIRDAQNAAIKKILTPAQIKQMEGMRRGMGGPGGPGGGRGRGPG